MTGDDQLFFFNWRRATLWEDTKITIQKVGESLVLTPKKHWTAFRTGINSFSADIFASGRDQPDFQEREEL